MPSRAAAKLAWPRAPARPTRGTLLQLSHRDDLLRRPILRLRRRRRLVVAVGGRGLAPDAARENLARAARRVRRVDARVRRRVRAAAETDAVAARVVADLAAGDGVHLAP